ncbi:MAG: YihY/virulence factor BrkB family protein [Acidobacteria bacterium]|nr:YihY/virulence factor BrkB family protein [Acidobacteriota bacterium]
MLRKIWDLLKDTVNGFIEDEALSRAASIAYFTIFSIAPLLLIVISIAGLVFGHEAAQAAILGQFSGLMGKSSGQALQTMLQSAGSQSQKSGAIATIVGVVTLLITASGAFGEIQSGLNKIWKAEPKAGLTRLVRARIASIGLIMTLGFLLVVSLAVSAGLAALGHWVEGFFPGGKVLMAVVNFVITLVLLSAVFAAIYKVLPDKQIAWRDVAVGAVATALLFTIGKSLIGIYIGSTNVAESYGTAGSLIVILLWIYYSTVTFLLGAEFTRAYAERFGSHSTQPQTEVARPSSPSRPAPGPELKPATAVSPDFLQHKAATTRRRIDQTWGAIRDRIPDPPAFAAKDGDGVSRDRPSWLQIAVAGLAVAVLRSARRAPRNNLSVASDLVASTERLPEQASAAPRPDLSARHLRPVSADQ